MREYIYPISGTQLVEAITLAAALTDQTDTPVRHKVHVTRYTCRPEPKKKLKTGFQAHDVFAPCRDSHKNNWLTQNATLMSACRA